MVAETYLNIANALVYLKRERSALEFAKKAVSASEETVVALQQQQQIPGLATSDHKLTREDIESKIM